MTKKFITEEQLFELKYRINGEYNGMCLAQIFAEELIKYNSLASERYRLPLVDAIKPYYHRYVDKSADCDKHIDVWFPDNSLLIIDLFEDDSWKGSHVLEGGVYKYVYEYIRKDKD